MGDFRFSEDPSCKKTWRFRCIISWEVVTVQIRLLYL